MTPYHEFQRAGSKNFPEKRGTCGTRMAIQQYMAEVRKVTVAQRREPAP